MIKTYKISLQGLGYKAQSATVTGNQSVESMPDCIFPILEGLPTLKDIKVSLDVSSDEDGMATSAAINIAFTLFQKEVGLL